MFDLPAKIQTMAQDMDSRLEQISNQQRLTNALLALLILTMMPHDANMTDAEVMYLQSLATLPPNG